MQKFKDTQKPTTDGMTAFENALQIGDTNFKTFIDTTQNGIITAKAYRDRLIDMVDSETNLADVAKMTTSQLELHARAILKDVDAIEALNKAATAAASQGLTDLAKRAEEFLGKKFGKLDMKKEFDKVEKEANEFAGRFFKAMDKSGFEGGKAFAERFAETPKKFIKSNKILDDFKPLISWIKANSHLPAKEFVKQLGIEWERLKPEAQTALAQLMSGLPDEAAIAGTATGASFSTAFKKAIILPQKGTVLGPLVSQFGGFKKGPETPTKIPTSTTPSTPTKIPAPNTTAFINAINSAQQRAVDMSNIVNKLKTVITKSNISPFVSAVNSAQNRGVDFAKIINGLKTKLQKPNISAFVSGINSAQNRALDMSKIVNGMKTKITINNSQALKAIDDVVKRMNDVKNITRTITIKTNTVSAQGGFHSSSLPQDTTIFAHKGESVKIGHEGGGDGGQMFTHSPSGGGGGGTTIINEFIISGNEIVNPVKLKRMMRTENGRLRSRFGPS